MAYRLSVSCQRSTKLLKQLQQVVSSLDIHHCYDNVIVNVLTVLTKLK